MKATTALGRIGKFPIHGTVVNIESADIAPLVKTIASTAKFLVAAGAVTAGIAIMSAATQTKKLTRRRLPITALAKVYEYDQRSFIGICLDDKIDFACANQTLSVGLNMVRSIVGYQRFRGYTIRLMDGSIFKQARLTTKHISFLTLAGPQKLNLFVGLWGKPYNSVEIIGVEPTDINALKRRLRFAIEHTRESVIAAIGEDVFSHFFK